MNEQLWWYLARAGGLVAAGLLVATLVLGILLATRALKGADRPAWLLAMHRWCSTLTIAGTALHVVGLVADRYVHFGWAEVLVPGASAWRPVATGLGVVALYLLVAVHATSLLMKRIPKHLWRWVHLTSYALVWLAIVHAGMAGTDATNRVFQAVAMLLTLAATSAVVLRIVLGRNHAAATAGRAGRAPARRATPPTTTERVGAAGR